MLGAKLKPELYGYNTIGNVDEVHEVLINNVRVNISIPDLHYILIMHSYYLQYQAYKRESIDMTDFLTQMSKTNVFTGLSDEYINSVFEKFIEMLPTLQQLKQYN